MPRTPAKENKTVKQLQAELKNLGLSPSGTKAVLVSRLQEAPSSPSTPSKSPRRGRSTSPSPARKKAATPRKASKSPGRPKRAASKSPAPTRRRKSTGSDVGVNVKKSVSSPASSASSSSDASEDSIEHKQDDTNGYLFIIVLITGLVLASGFYFNLPEVNYNDLEKLKCIPTPHNLECLQRWNTVLLDITAHNFVWVVSAYCAVFITLQAFNIPGTIALVVLGGSLFGFGLGYLLADLCSVVGASCAFAVSKYKLSSIIIARFPERLATFRAKIDAHRHSLLFYMLFLRVTPMVPNWLVNLASPIFDVPYWMFAFATAVGCSPQLALFSQAGTTLSEITSSGDLAHSTNSILMLLSLGVLTLVPTLPPVQRALERMLGTR